MTASASSELECVELGLEPLADRRLLVLPEGDGCQPQPLDEVDRSPRPPVR